MPEDAPVRGGEACISESLMDRKLSRVGGERVFLLLVQRSGQAVEQFQRCFSRERRQNVTGSCCKMFPDTDKYQILKVGGKRLFLSE